MLWDELFLEILVYHSLCILRPLLKTILASFLIGLLMDVNLFLDKYLHKVPWVIGGGSFKGINESTMHFYVTKDINESINELL